MGKFHIAKNGKISKCTAKNNCPLGGLHVEANTLEDAQKEMNKELAKQNPILANNSKVGTDGDYHDLDKLGGTMIAESYNGRTLYKLNDDYYKNELYGDQWETHKITKKEALEWLNENEDYWKENDFDIEAELLINESQMLKNPTLTTELKDWYKNEYPLDDMGTEINDKINFNGLYEDLKNGKDVYETIGAGDSIIRERIFGKLAELKGVEYDEIYSLWLSKGKNNSLSMTSKPEVKINKMGRMPDKVRNEAQEKINEFCETLQKDNTYYNKILDTVRETGLFVGDKTVDEYSPDMSSKRNVYKITDENDVELNHMLIINEHFYSDDSIEVNSYIS